MKFLPKFIICCRASTVGPVEEAAQNQQLVRRHPWQWKPSLAVIIEESVDLSSQCKGKKGRKKSHKSKSVITTGDYDRKNQASPSLSRQSSFTAPYMMFC